MFAKKYCFPLPIVVKLKISISKFRCLEVAHCYYIHILIRYSHKLIDSLVFYNWSQRYISLETVVHLSGQCDIVVRPG